MTLAILHPSYKMDPQTKQETKYKAKSMMRVISDKLDVASAKIRGEDGSDLDVAVVKATLQDEVVPKEKHVRTLKIACSGSAPRQQVRSRIIRATRSLLLWWQTLLL
jgi:hypothetical protein